MKDTKDDDLLQQVPSNRSKICNREGLKLDFHWFLFIGKGITFLLMLILFVESSMTHFFIVNESWTYIFLKKRCKKNHERTQIDPHPSRGCESFLQPPMSYPTALEFCQRCVSPRTTSPAPLVVLDAWWSPFAYDVRSFLRKVSSASANVQPQTIIHHNSFRCQRTIPRKSSIVIQEAKS